MNKSNKNTKEMKNTAVDRAKIKAIGNVKKVK